MKILTFVDLHGNKKALDKIISRGKKKDIDLLVCAGDFTIFEEAQDMIMTKLDKVGKPVLFVHGNHEDASEVRKSCKKTKNCKFIHKSAFRFENYLFLGWGGGGFSFRDRGFEKEVKRFRNMIKKDDMVVLVSHAPPFKTKIDDIFGEHAGNKSLRKFIEKVKPVLAVSGHLHECVGEDKIGKTKVINPGYKGKVVTL